MNAIKVLLRRRLFVLDGEHATENGTVVIRQWIDNTQEYIYAVT